MNVVRSLPLALIVLLAATVASAHGPEKLGKVNFPTSCAAAVQADFERSVALLHSFWFQPAIKASRPSPLELTKSADSERPEIVRAKAFVTAN